MKEVTCKCENVFEIEDDKSYKDIISKKEDRRRYVRDINVTGDCSCELDGDTHDVDKVSLEVESKVLNLTKKYEKHLSDLRERFKGVRYF